jgi:hypothetical protein
MDATRRWPMALIPGALTRRNGCLRAAWKAIPGGGRVGGVSSNGAANTGVACIDASQHIVLDAQMIERNIFTERKADSALSYLLAVLLGILFACLIVFWAACEVC